MSQPNSWRRCRIAEVTEKAATWNPRNDPRETIRYVDVSGISREELRIVAETNYSATQAPSRARKIVKTGDTIVATVRPTLRRIAQVPASFDGEIVSTAFCVLRPNRDQMAPDFLFFATQLDAVMSGIAALETGASYPAVRDSDILEQLIPVPPLAEQREIAAVLNSTRSSLLHEGGCESAAVDFESAAMRALFTRGLKGEAQKATEIGSVPQSWRVGTIGEMARFQRGFDITKSEQADGQVPVVSSGGIKSYHNIAGAVGPGVLIGRKGSIGLLHFVETDYWPHDTTLWCTDYLGNVPKFVFYRLHSIDMKRLDSGAANPALNRNFLHKEMVSWPAPEEQREIVALLDAIDRKIDLHRRKRVVLNDLFKALLHKLMTGEIRVADLDLTALGSRQAAEVAA